MSTKLSVKLHTWRMCGVNGFICVWSLMSLNFSPKQTLWPYPCLLLLLLSSLSCQWLQMIECLACNMLCCQISSQPYICFYTVLWSHWARLKLQQLFRQEVRHRAEGRRGKTKQRRGWADGWWRKIGEGRLEGPESGGGGNGKKVGRGVRWGKGR